MGKANPYVAKKFLRGDGRYAHPDGAEIEHNTLSGLNDDDHVQYHNDTRGDARYLVAIDWHEVGGDGEPAFQNNWMNSGDPYDTLKFGIDVHGWVHIEGRAKNGTLDTTIFTLPASYRPNKQKSYRPDSGHSTPRIVIETNGNVKFLTS